MTKITKNKGSSGSRVACAVIGEKPAESDNTLLIIIIIVVVVIILLILTAILIYYCIKK
jgi:flagellar basal body-associated protein FliL